MYDKGSINVEFVIVFPLLLFIFSSVMEISLIMFRDAWAQYATVKVVKEEARYLATYSATTDCVGLSNTISENVDNRLRNDYALIDAEVTANVTGSADHPYALVVVDVETPRSCFFCGVNLINSTSKVRTQFDVENSSIVCS